MARAEPEITATRTITVGSRTATVYLEKYERWVISAIREEVGPTMRGDDETFGTPEEALEYATKLLQE